MTTRLRREGQKQIQWPPSSWFCFRILEATIQKLVDKNRFLQKSVFLQLFDFILEQQRLTHDPGRLMSKIQFESKCKFLPALELQTLFKF